MAKSNKSKPAPKAVLDNSAPVDLLKEPYKAWALNLQGNILNGHGRNHTVHLFLRLPSDQAAAKSLIWQLSTLVTSAHKQEKERCQFKKYRIPGRLFGNLVISASGYRKLGHADAELATAFKEDPEGLRATRSNFVEGMAAHAVSDLGDPPPGDWDDTFSQGAVDAMLLLADDGDTYLLREARTVIDFIESRKGELAGVEIGTALRTEGGEGIEHFGYVDGRSQPLFLASNFRTDAGEEGVVLGNDGKMDRTRTFEDLGSGSKGGAIDVWDPFEPLRRVLKPDPLTTLPDCHGSYFVFRKLEQNVRDFTIAEQLLADKLGFKAEERERAGAMAVGRFRDGTPLVLNRTDGLVPPKDNNFRHDNDKASGPNKGEALRCPFQGHIRKTNPRGDIIRQLGGTEENERSRRIARRGITYGQRSRHPDAFQALDDLPSEGVGLLFMCFQASIRQQFAFMQRGWANNQDFAFGKTGIDPIIGQLDEDKHDGTKVTQIGQHWPVDWDKAGGTKAFFLGHFVKMKGGEFFFAPSLPYLASLAAGEPVAPTIAEVAGASNVGA